MLDNLGWFFPSTGKGETDGFKDSQLEFFQGNHEQYIAREAIQNAIDARKNNDEPVQVEFERFEIPVGEFPGFSEFKDVLTKCGNYIGEQGQDEAALFFQNAINIMESEKITVLRIGDYNTSGLTGGDNDSEGNWNRLVKASGTSSSKGATGGSFGIGKGAPIAASRLRTVFYSTKTADGVAFQGKARLTSHEKNNDVLRGIGFYSSLAENSAIRDIDSIPSRFRRDKVGTDIFIMGYEKKENWEFKLAESIIENFWLPMHTEDLVVTIISEDEGKEVISKENLLTIIESAGKKNNKFPPLVLPFLEAYTDCPKPFRKNLGRLGEAVLYFKKKEGFPREVMMARKPKILVRKKKYSVLREKYAGIFLCVNDVGNRILREMEPPAHDEWEQDRHGKGEAIWREIDSFIRESLKSIANPVGHGAQDIPGLDMFLPDSFFEDDSFGKSTIRTEDSNFSAAEESPKEIAKPKTFTISTLPIRNDGIHTKDIVQSGGNNPEPGSRNGKPTKKPANGGGIGGEEDLGNDHMGQISSDNVTFRSFVEKSPDGKKEYLFILKAKIDCRGDIIVIAVGDDTNVMIPVDSATNTQTGQIYRVDKGVIKDVEIPEGFILKLRVGLQGNHRYALTLSKNEA